MHPFDWIFFDIGSTLVDEQAAYDHRIRDMIAGTGLTFEQVDEMRRTFAMQGSDGNGQIIPHFHLKKTPWHSEDEVLYPDTKAMLAWLTGQGYHLGVLANQAPGLRQRLENWDIAHYFSHIVSSAEVGAAKPDRAIFERALAMAGCGPERAVMIGDRLDNDIFPAKACGMQTIWLRCGLAELQSAELAQGRADAIIDSLDELRELLKKPYLWKLTPTLTGTILDVGGGGDGVIGRLYGRQVTAIDNRQEELDEAPDDFEKRLMDARCLDFADDTFDHVTFFYSLMFMGADTRRQALREAARVVRPGGSICLWDALIPADAPQPFLAELDIALPGEIIRTTYGVGGDVPPLNGQFLVDLCRGLGLQLTHLAQENGHFFVSFVKVCATESTSAAGPVSMTREQSRENS